MSALLAQATHGPVGYAAARLITRAGLKLGMFLDCVTAGDGANAVPLLAAVLGLLQRVPRLRWDILCDTVRRGIKPAPLGLSVLPRLLVPRDYPVCVSVRPDDPHSAELLNPAHWYMSLAE